MLIIINSYVIIKSNNNDGNDDAQNKDKKILKYRVYANDDS